MRKFLVLKVCLAFQLAWPISGFAQAWLSPKHTGTISVSHQYHYIDAHAIEGDWLKEFRGIDLGRIRSHAVVVNADYSLTDKLAFKVTLPYVGARYEAEELSDHDLDTDNGMSHPSFQDLGLGVRYNLLESPVMFTPFIGYGFPTHSYEYFAHSAIGMRLKSLQLGTFLGRRLYPLLPDAFLQGHYSYEFVPRVRGINVNRSNIDLQFGYFLNSSLTAFGLVIGTHSHGGVSPYIIYDKDTFEIIDQDLYTQHDRIEIVRTWNVGGGAAYSINDSWQAYFTVLHTAYMRNGHPLKYQISTGMIWSFGDLTNVLRCFC